MTLYEIKSAAAAYLEKDQSAFTVNDVDLGLIGLNQVRTTAEETNDFNFTRKLLTVSVDGVTGGSLDTAIEYGDDSEDPTVYAIKTIIDVGLFDVDGNFVPVDWTTTADSLNIQREDNAYTFRYPTDAQAAVNVYGQARFLFGGNRVFYFPRTEDTTFELGIVAHTFTPDWTDNDVGQDAADAYAGPWVTKGSQYLLWSLVLNLNHLAKGFVFRQEGNLPPPQTLADAGLEAITRWDNFMFEQNRRHSR